MSVLRRLLWILAAAAMGAACGFDDPYHPGEQREFRMYLDPRYDRLLGDGVLAAGGTTRLVVRAEGTDARDLVVTSENPETVELDEARVLLQVPTGWFSCLFGCPTSVVGTVGLRAIRSGEARLVFHERGAQVDAVTVTVAEATSVTARTLAIYTDHHRDQAPYSSYTGGYPEPGRAIQVRRDDALVMAAVPMDAEGRELLAQEPMEYSSSGPAVTTPTPTSTWFHAEQPGSAAVLVKFGELVGSVQVHVGE